MIVTKGNFINKILNGLNNGEILFLSHNLKLLIDWCDGTMCFQGQMTNYVVGISGTKFFKRLAPTKVLRSLVRHLETRLYEAP